MEQMTPGSWDSLGTHWGTALSDFIASLFSSCDTNLFRATLFPLRSSPSGLCSLTWLGFCPSTTDVRPLAGQCRNTLLLLAVTSSVLKQEIKLAQNLNKEGSAWFFKYVYTNSSEAWQFNNISGIQYQLSLTLLISPFSFLIQKLIPRKFSIHFKLAQNCVELSKISVFLERETITSQSFPGI